MVFSMDIIKNKLRDLREDLDLRQIDVAKATGIDQKTLSNYETGKTNPDSYSLIKLADFYQVSIDYLLGYSTLNLKSNNDIITKLDKIEKEINELKRFINKNVSHK